MPPLVDLPHQTGACAILLSKYLTGYLPVDIVTGVCAVTLVFLLCREYYRKAGKGDRTMLVVVMFGMFIGFPLYVFGVGYLLVPLIPRLGDSVVMGLIFFITFLLTPALFILHLVLRARASNRRDTHPGSDLKP